MKNFLTIQWRVCKIVRVDDDHLEVTFCGPTPAMNITQTLHQSETPQINTIFELQLRRMEP